VRHILLKWQRLTGLGKKTSSRRRGPGEKFSLHADGPRTYRSQEPAHDLLFSMIALAAITGTIGCPEEGLTFLNNFPPSKSRANPKEIRIQSSLVSAGRYGPGGQLPKEDLSNPRDHLG